MSELSTNLIEFLDPFTKKMEHFKRNTHNTIRTNYLKEVFDEISKNPNFTSVNLTNKQLRDEDLQIFFQTLQTHCKLACLDLSLNQIGDQGATFLSTILRTKRNGIKRLDLTHNQITDKGAIRLIHSFLRNKKIEEIKLSLNNTSLHILKIIEYINCRRRNQRVLARQNGFSKKRKRIKNLINKSKIEKEKKEKKITTKATNTNIKARTGLKTSTKTNNRTKSKKKTTTIIKTNINNKAKTKNKKIIIKAERGTKTLTKPRPKKPNAYWSHDEKSIVTHQNLQEQVQDPNQETERFTFHSGYFESKIEEKSGYSTESLAKSNSKCSSEHDSDYSIDDNEISRCLQISNPKFFSQSFNKNLRQSNGNHKIQKDQLKDRDQKKIQQDINISNKQPQKISRNEKRKEDKETEISQCANNTEKNNLKKSLTKKLQLQNFQKKFIELKLLLDFVVSLNNLDIKTSSEKLNQFQELNWDPIKKELLFILENRTQINYEHNHIQRKLKSLKNSLNVVKQKSNYANSQLNKHLLQANELIEKIKKQQKLINELKKKNHYKSKNIYLHQK
ncbi:ynein regulatory complex subunit [Anaeramoeba flamelloides]|uniref:Ynein regulatory complex subunit n=1 Tax=Anaeramoeba flamelloides TaxID=1746091 RepID=A0AAV7Y7V9_9EUKA|nr:ynein regulatory complex subunit [Anaeramoeba flamelloides]